MFKQIIVSVLASSIFIAVYGYSVHTDQLMITMLHIGQGDAFYIRTPNGVDMVVDGGPDRSVIYELGETLLPTDHQLDYVVATHPDADHIAGLTELPEYYTIGTLISSGRTKETGFAEIFEQWPALGIKSLTPKRGDRLQIDQDTWLEFLHPVAGEAHQDFNDDSVVFILHYKNVQALFTGDAPTEIEEEIVEYTEKNGGVPDINILKVGHHGSRTSTSQLLLQTMRPEIALLSAGIENKFGHPHAGPLALFENEGMQVYRTDTQGRITCFSDGNTIECSTQVIR